MTGTGSMIGGYDLVLPHSRRSGGEIMALVTRVVWNRWPEAIFQGPDGEVYDRFWVVPLGRLDQLFIYENPAVWKSWEKAEATPFTANRMVHVLVGPKTVTLVLDAMSPFWASVARQLEGMLSYGGP